MTTINLLTQGQQLINASKVVIASGDVDSVQLHVEFDSVEWNTYPTRSATFYTSNDATVYEKLLLNDKCVVPFEVLQESGILFIGVRGVSSDGERVKTSTLVKYKISEGATAGDKTLNPTMDLYQQYLAALKTEASPALQAMATEIRTILETEAETLREEAVATNEAARAMLEALQGTVVWENPDPTKELDSFAIEQISSAFKSFRVIYTVDTSSNTHDEKTISKKGVLYKLTSDCYSYRDDLYYRDIYISDTYITIHGGIGFQGTPNNRILIPVKIIGYKY